MILVLFFFFFLFLFVIFPILLSLDLLKCLLRKLYVAYLSTQPHLEHLILKHEYLLCLAELINDFLLLLGLLLEQLVLHLVRLARGARFGPRCLLFALNRFDGGLPLGPPDGLGLVGLLDCELELHDHLQLLELALGRLVECQLARANLSLQLLRETLVGSHDLALVEQRRLHYRQVLLHYLFSIFLQWQSLVAHLLKDGL